MKKGSKRTQETKDKISVALMGHGVTCETRDKMRKSHLGKAQPHIGVPRTDETKNKISKSLTGRYMGSNHPGWKGGSDATAARTEERKRGYGYTSINKRGFDMEGHHLTKNLVLYIPKDLHDKFRGRNKHTPIRPKTMVEVNMAALKWLVSDEGQKTIKNARKQSI